MAYTEITPAERIRQLNGISGETASILQDAGQACKALSLQAGDEGSDIDARKAQFEESSKAVFTGIQSITAQLRRQVYALEEAGITAAEAPTSSSRAQQPNAASGRSGSAAAPQADVERITNGGLGNLDVGWLNSRGNKVGAEKEAELMKEARELAQKLLQDRQTET